MINWSGWALDDPLTVLAALGDRKVEMQHRHVVCEHVTRAYPERTNRAPRPAEIKIIGWASDSRIQAALVTVDGRTRRPDGRLYHLTLVRIDAAQDVESNDLLTRADRRDTITWINPIRVGTTPFLRPIRFGSSRP